MAVRTRAHNEEGFLMIELIAATLVLSIGLLALIGAYSFGYYAIGSSGRTSAAGLLANNQLELYSSLRYSNIGLDATALASVKATDPTYSTDESALPGSGTDATINGCASAQCTPVQTLTGPDRKIYKVETFIRFLANPNISTRSEKVVTVVVRNAGTSGSAKVLTMQTAFDPGSPATATPTIANCAQIGVKCESELVAPMVVDNTHLQIVYTDDGTPRLGGGFSPTAFLNSVQSLGVSMAATDGWPLNYVTNFGGSASDKNQQLITITLPTGLPPGCYTVLVTTSDYDGPDTDQWAWPISVDTNGTVTTVSSC